MTSTELLTCPDLLTSAELLTCDQYEPVDVFVEVIQDLAVHRASVGRGQQVLLGPLELPVQTSHTLLQQTGQSQARVSGQGDVMISIE